MDSRRCFQGEGRLTVVERQRVSRSQRSLYLNFVGEGSKSNVLRLGIGHGESGPSSWQKKSDQIRRLPPGEPEVPAAKHVVLVPLQ